MPPLSPERLLLAKTMAFGTRLRIKIDNAAEAAPIGVICGGSVQREDVKEEDVARIHYREDDILGIDLIFMNHIVFTAIVLDQSALVRARKHFNATIFPGRLIDGEPHRQPHSLTTTT